MFFNCCAVPLFHYTVFDSMIDSAGVLAGARRAAPV
jgi:hypothetical protein